MRHTIRQGMGKGRGSGYKNILRGHDHKVHTQSGHGIKQPQKVNFLYTKVGYSKKYLGGLSKNEIDRQYDRFKDVRTVSPGDEGYITTFSPGDKGYITYPKSHKRHK